MSYRWEEVGFGAITTGQGKCDAAACIRCAIYVERLSVMCCIQACICGQQTDIGAVSWAAASCICWKLEVCVIITAILRLIRICVPSLYRRLVILRSGYISCIRALYCTLWLMCSGCSKVFNYAWSNPIDFCFDFKKVFILVWVQPQFTVYMLAVSTGDEHDDIMEASEMTSNAVFKHDLWTNDSWLNWFKFLNIFFSLYICMCEDF